MRWVPSSDSFSSGQRRIPRTLLGSAPPLALSSSPSNHQSTRQHQHLPPADLERACSRPQHWPHPCTSSTWGPGCFSTLGPLPGTRRSPLTPWPASWSGAVSLEPAHQLRLRREKSHPDNSLLTQAAEEVTKGSQATQTQSVTVQLHTIWWPWKTKPW